MERRVFIRLTADGETIIIPETVDGMRIASGSEPQVIEILGKGPTSYPSFANLKVISFSNAQFNRRWIERFISGGYTPREYADWLNDKAERLIPCHLVLESDIPTYAHDGMVLISFNSWEVRVGEEDNIHYDLDMTEHNPNYVEVITPTETGVIEPPLPPREDPRPPPPQVYTVVSGDSLWRIAARKTGDGNRWREIYNLPENQATIHERAPASRQGDLIFPGQQLVIPDSWR